MTRYGLTKLAAEQLGWLYWRQFGLPVVALRFFTVYGPRQRPDMFFNLLCHAALGGRSIDIYGDGEQSREFTYVDDIVRGVIAAGQRGEPGEAYNLGGGASATVNEAIEMMRQISGGRIEARYVASQVGDARRTSADISRARRVLGYEPQIGLEEGLKREYRWFEAAARD